MTAPNAPQPPAATPERFTSRRTLKFKACFRALPQEIRAKAKQAYRMWQQQPNAAGLNYKKLSGTDVWSIQIDGNYRALALKDGPRVVWFWIGDHVEYLRQIGRA